MNGYSTHPVDDPDPGAQLISMMLRWKLPPEFLAHRRATRERGSRLDDGGRRSRP